MTTRHGLWRGTGYVLMATATGCAADGAPSEGGRIRSALEVPAECAAVALPGPLREIEDDVLDVRMGPCGDITLLEGGGGFAGRYWDGALATSTVVDDVGAMRLSATSRRLGWYLHGGGAAGTIDLATSTPFAAPAVGFDVGFGFVRVDDTAVMWGCDGSDLRVDDDLVMSGVDCMAVSAHEASGRLLAADAASRELHVIDAASGERHATGVHYGVQVAYQTTLSAMRWSADGRLAFVQDTRFDECGDWICLTGGTGAIVIDTTTGEERGVLPGAVEASVGTPDRRPVVVASAVGARAVGFDGGGAGTLGYVRSDLGVGVIADAREPFTLSEDGDYVFAAVGREQELVRVSTEGDEIHTGLVDIDDLAVSAGGTFAAVDQWRGDAQVWRITRWDAEGGAVVLAELEQPGAVHWVGDDGTVLATGPFDGTDSTWRTVLFAPDGSERATWDGGPATVVAVADTLFMDLGRSITSVIPATGTSAVIAIGRLAGVLSDAAKVRVALLVEGDGKMALWAGERPTD